jgi:hypothetical protein
MNLMSSDLFIIQSQFYQVRTSLYLYRLNIYPCKLYFYVDYNNNLVLVFCNGLYNSDIYLYLWVYLDCCFYGVKVGVFFRPA